jgi:hypothetical protein
MAPVFIDDNRFALYQGATCVVLKSAREQLQGFSPRALIAGAEARTSVAFGTAKAVP